MSSVLERLRQFRGSRPANVFASFVFLAVGIYDIAAYSGIASRVLGGLFVLIGLLGLYNQFRGESVVDTLTAGSK